MANGGLAEFLLARIAEDERAISGDATVHLSGHIRNGDTPSLRIAWDKRRVLAECEAKQRIVQCWIDAWNALCRIPAPEQLTSDAFGEACQLLALVYADHPDYQPEWKP